MKTLYVDNYRGFTDTYIPIMDVNFLVGENSTGKTSILNLINLLMSARFWVFPDFNNDEVKMGYFNEIVNQSSPNKNYIDIGIEKETGNGDKTVKYIWIRFIDLNNIPKIKNCAICNGKQTCHIDINEKGTNFKSISHEKTDFKQWIELAKASITGEYEKLLNERDTNMLPFRAIISIAYRRMLNPQAKKAVITGTMSLFTARFMWFAPIRAKARRIYDMYRAHYSADGEHMPLLLYGMLKAKNRPKDLINSLFAFGKASNLFDQLQISSMNNIAGSPFSINVKYKKMPMSITNVGYGVSQILPIIVQVLLGRKTIFAIQQPEVHLHPKAQAAFGDIIYQSANTDKNKFLIETHSDYTINRFRYCIRKARGCAMVKSQIIFFERKGNETIAYSLPFKKDGGYSDETPEAYGKFFIDEELKIIQL